MIKKVGNLGIVVLVFEESTGINGLFQIYGDGGIKQRLVLEV